MAQRIPRWSIITIAGAAALIAGAFVARIAVSPNTGSDAATLLSISLPDSDGHEQRLDQWRGKVLVVNFWATWCAPCREEMREFVAKQKVSGGKGLQFVGIAVDQADKVQQFAKEIDLNYPALIGGMGALQLSQTLGNDLMALPFTVIVSRDGEVVYTQLGPIKQAKLDSIVDKLL
jgi:peroxiredoxin